MPRSSSRRMSSSSTSAGYPVFSATTAISAETLGSLAATWETRVPAGSGAGPTSLISAARAADRDGRHRQASGRQFDASDRRRLAPAKPLPRDVLLLLQELEECRVRLLLALEELAVEIGRLLGHSLERRHVLLRGLEGRGQSPGWSRRVRPRRDAGWPLRVQGRFRSMQRDGRVLAILMMRIRPFGRIHRSIGLGV